VITTLRDRKQGAPEAGNSRVKALRQVFKTGIAEKLIDRNPAAEVKYLQVATEGFHPWTPAEVRKFEERHPVGTKARLAMALLLYLGCRRSDVVLWGPQHVREVMDMPPELQAVHAGRWLQYTQHKNRKKNPVTLALPILPELEQTLAASPVGNLMWPVTAFGKGHTSNGFGTWFRRRCDEAKLPQCSAHGLRKAGAARAAESGTTAHQSNGYLWLADVEGGRALHQGGRTDAAGRWSNALDCIFKIGREH